MRRNLCWSLINKYFSFRGLRDKKRQRGLIQLFFKIDLVFSKYNVTFAAIKEKRLKHSWEKFGE